MSCIWMMLLAGQCYCAFYAKRVQCSSQGFNLSICSYAVFFLMSLSIVTPYTSPITSPKTAYVHDHLKKILLFWALTPLFSDLGCT